MTDVLVRPRSARKAKGDGHTRRAEILSAAERIFIAEGYEGATIRKIAEDVGVSSTCLYMHFRDKDEMLLEICREAMADLLSATSEMAERPLGAVERLRLILRAYIQFGLSHPNAYRLIFCSSPLNASLAKQQTTRELGAACAQLVASVVREVAAEGRLRPGDPQVAHQALWAGCHGLVALMITKPDVAWAPAEQIGATLIDGLMFGMIAD